MASLFPVAVDNLPDNHVDNVGETVHAQTVNDIADSINATQTALFTGGPLSLVDHKAAANPHPGYQVRSERDVAGGYPSLDGSALISAGEMPGGSVTQHVAQSNPHTQYERTTNKGIASGYAELDSGILVPTNRLGSGSATSGKYLGGDRAWHAVDWTELTTKPTTFTPSAHAPTHYTAGSDPLTPANIGAETVANKNAAGGYAGLSASTLIALAQLGTGTPSSANYLRGDGTWATPSGSGGNFSGLMMLSDNTTYPVTPSATFLDQTAAMQAWLNANPTLIHYLLPGTYWCHLLSLASLEKLQALIPGSVTIKNLGSGSSGAQSTTLTAQITGGAGAICEGIKFDGQVGTVTWTAYTNTTNAKDSAIYAGNTLTAANAQIGMTVVACTFINQYAGAVYMQNVTNADIRFCTIDNITLQAIWLHRHCDNAIVAFNRLTNLKNDGIKIHGPNNDTGANNADNSEAPIIAFNAISYAGQVSANASLAIELWGNGGSTWTTHGCPRAKIVGNTIIGPDSGTRVYGVSIDRSPNSEIASNSARKNIHYGLESAGSYRSHFMGNDINDADYGMSISRGNPTYQEDGGLMIVGNTFDTCNTYGLQAYANAAATNGAETIRNLIITGNSFIDCPVGTYFNSANVHHNNVVGNTFTLKYMAAAMVGVKCFFSSYNVISENNCVPDKAGNGATLSAFGITGVYLQGDGTTACAFNRVTNNHVDSSRPDGGAVNVNSNFVFDTKCENNEITNNTGINAQFSFIDHFNSGTAGVANPNHIAYNLSDKDVSSNVRAIDTVIWFAGGGLRMRKGTETIVAPGATYLTFRTEASATSGKGKLVAYAGTSTTGTIVIDAVGSGF